MTTTDEQGNMPTNPHTSPYRNPEEEAEEQAQQDTHNLLATHTTATTITTTK